MIQPLIWGRDTAPRFIMTLRLLLVGANEEAKLEGA